MSEDTQGLEAKAHGSGQAVNVVIGHGVGIWIFLAVVVVALLVATSTKVSSDAYAKASAAERALIDQQTYSQMVLIWMREAKAAGDAAGVKMPPVPVFKPTPAK